MNQSICSHLAILTTVLIFGSTVSVFAQIKVGDNPTTLNPDALLEIETTNKGLLLPRVALTSTTDAAPLSAHVQGMIVYNTADVPAPGDVTTGYYYNDGTQWVRLAGDNSIANEWMITGNAGTDEASNFIGTSDAVAFVTRTDNTERMRVTGTGNVGIGTPDPWGLLEVKSDNAFVTNLYVTNTSNTGAAQTILRTNNKTYVIGANNASGSFAISDASTGQSRMVINSLGNVAIGGSASPTEKLQVEGNINFSGALMPDNQAGSVGQALLSGGAGAPPTWGSPIAAFGDVKTGFQTTDHSGWILLDGRAISSLSPDQQAQATALGFGANLPDATDAYLSQNGTALGSVSGSNARTITQANLPNVNFTGTTSNSGTHTHTIPGQNFPTNTSGSGNAPAQIRTGAGFQSGASGDHSHTVTVASGGSNTPLDIKPQTLSVNVFIFLGL
jgi:hypothetical protein